MKIPFVKLHGAQNDFLLTRLHEARLHEAGAADLSKISIAICNRYTGVGADGWMLVDATGNSDFDATIRLFNSDGSEPELSGNGTRCAAALLARDNPTATLFRILTGAGVKALRLISQSGTEYQFEMNMGEVKLEELHATVQGRDAVLINPGNPQCAFPVDGFAFDWRVLGKATENDSRFPKRTNVSFVKRIDEHTIDVRFWERGAGETNSSGTGSTGAAKAALARGLVSNPVNVLTPAGPLVVNFTDAGALLTGPAEFVAEGVYFLRE